MIQNIIEPQDLRSHLASIAADGLDIFTLEEDSVRGAILNGTTLVNAMRANHGLGILETLALGYGYMATTLCSMQIKGQDRIRYNLDCQGPMGGMSVDADAQGSVRGYLKVDQFPLNGPVESFDLGPWIGEGTITLTRMLEGAKTPVSGSTTLRYKNIADDLAMHFKESEQTHTAFYLSINFDRQGQVRGAGGIFLQALPNADELILEDLDLWLPQLPSLGKSLAGGATGTSYLHKHFAAFGPRLIGVRKAEFSCDCNKESFRAYFISMDKDKRLELYDAGAEPMVVKCHNCASSYTFSRAELEL